MGARPPSRLAWQTKIFLPKYSDFRRGWGGADKNGKEIFGLLRRFKSDRKTVIIFLRLKLTSKRHWISYKASEEHNVFRIVDVRKLQWLMIDGHGDPNTSKEFDGAR